MSQHTIDRLRHAPLSPDKSPSEVYMQRTLVQSQHVQMRGYLREKCRSAALVVSAIVGSPKLHVTARLLSPFSVEVDRRAHDLPNPCDRHAGVLSITEEDVRNEQGGPSV